MPSNRLPRINKLLRKSKRPFWTPIALLTVAACKGGGGLEETAESTINLHGAVIKGPLYNALVYLDLNGDGIGGADGDLSTLTDTNGQYSFINVPETLAAFARVIVVTNGSTVDMSSGTVLDGVTLEAPAGALVVTPATTILARAGGALTPDEVSQVLGLPAGLDPLSYNPYAGDADAADAASFEVIGQQLMATIRAFAAAAEGAGVGQQQALDAAFEAVLEVVTSRAEGEVEAIDFSSGIDLAEIQTQVALRVTQIASAAPQEGISVSEAAFAGLADETSLALGNVNATIEAIGNDLVGAGVPLNSIEFQTVFSTTQVLVEQIKAAVELEVATPGANASDQISFTNMDKVNEAVANAVPSSLALSKNTVLEDDQSLIVGILSASDDADAAGLRYSIAEVSGSDHVAFQIRNGNELHLRQVADFEAKSSFIVYIDVTDLGGKSLRGAFTIRVLDVNDAPVGVADTLSATEDTAVTYSAADLLGNDTDADGNTLSIKNVASGIGGTAVLNQDGTVTFTPTANFNGAASFSYVATDGFADTAPVTVMVNVAAVNDAPMAVSDTLYATEDTAVTFTAAYLLGNDTDVEGDTLSIKSVTAYTGGMAVLNPNGTVTFTPTANFNGAASFSYIATDGTADTAATRVTVNVGAVNDAPVIVSGATGSVAENAASSTVIYTAQASDVDTGTTLTYSLGGADASLLDIDPSTGAVTLKASANFEAKSSYSFNVIATDNGTGSLSDTKAVSVNITDVNEAPTADGTVAAQTAVNGQLFSLDVGGYFADVDAGNNGTLTYSATGLPSGITIDSSTGVISGTASSDRSSAAVVVTATDGGSLFATQSFNLGVVSAPAITGLASNVAVAKSGDALTLAATVSEAVTVNTNGGIPTLTLDVGGQTLTATYSGGSGTTSLTFTATAGAGDDSTVSVTAINLNGGTITGNTTAQGLLTTATGQVVPSFIVDNTNPSFTSGATANVAENGSGTAYASAVTDATTVTYTLGGTDAALFNISSTGAVTFKTAPDFEVSGDNGSNNVYDVTVTATDAAGNQNTQAVAITVTNVNEAPSITSGATASFAENGTGTVYTATATDPDAGTTLVYTLGGTDANLFNIDASTGVVTFKSAPNFEAPADEGANNVYDITVTATDNGTGSLSDTKAVTVSVTDVNDAPVIVSVSSVALSAASGVSNGFLNVGDVLSVTVTMSETAVVSTSGGTPLIALNVGGVTKYARYASGSSSTALVFTYTVEAELTDTDGISIDANAVQLNSGSITSVSGENAILTHEAVAADSGYKVDTTTPIYSSVALANDSLSVEITYSEALSGTGLSTDMFDLQVGGVSYNIASISVTGNVLSLNLETAIPAGKAITVAYAATASNSIKDLAGNIAADLDATLVRGSAPTASAYVTTAVADSGNTEIDVLLNGDKWGADLGTGTTLTYSFPSWTSSTPSFYGPNESSIYSSYNEPYASTVFGLDAIHQANVRTALDYWGQVAKLTFVEVSETTTEVGDLRFAFSSDVSGSTWGWGWLPSQYYPSGGDIWINPNVSLESWAPGTDHFMAMLHEIGHALGFKHPFEGSPQINYDNQALTVMSYTQADSSTWWTYNGTGYDGVYVSPQTPMVYDIAAAQYLYGANLEHNTGNNLYTFDEAVPFFQTIWDAGGIDTISLDNFSLDCSIDLRPGALSTVHYYEYISSNIINEIVNNLGIAYGAWIENAVGGSGNDVFIGNILSNELTGGLGVDTFCIQFGDSKLSDFDVITDFRGDKISVFNGSTEVNISSGGLDVAATSTRAAYSSASMIADLSSLDSIETIFDAVTAVEAALASVGSSIMGQAAIFDYLTDAYAFISDGNDGVGDQDILIKLDGRQVNQGGSIVSGDLLIDLEADLTITASDTTLSIGDSSLITMTFLAEPLNLPTVAVSAGTLSDFVQSQSNPLVYTATLTPPDSGSTNAITMSVGSWTDTNGNIGTTSSLPSFNTSSVSAFAFLLNAPQDVLTSDLIVSDSGNNVVITGTLSHALTASRTLKYSLDGGSNWSAVTDTNSDIYKFQFSVSGLNLGSNQLQLAVFDGESH